RGSGSAPPRRRGRASAAGHARGRRCGRHSRRLGEPPAREPTPTRPCSAPALTARLRADFPTSRGDAPLAALGGTLEEQRLAGNRRHGGRLERLGDEEGGLGSLAGQEALGIGGDEYHGRFEGREQFVDGLKSRAAIGELDIRQNEPWLLFLGQRQSL